LKKRTQEAAKTKEEGEGTDLNLKKGTKID
jgi:hypothetical protein